MEAYNTNRNPSVRNVPAELTKLRQWIVWRYNADRTKKEPVDSRTGRLLKWSDPDNWTTFEEAVNAASRYGHDGVGFVFTASDPYCGVDLDKCIDSDTGQVHPAAEEIVSRLRSYAEISPSGIGIKGFVRAVKPDSRCNTTDTPWGGKLEIYDRGRWFAVTGWAYGQDPIRDAQEAVEGLYERFLESEPSAEIVPMRKTVGLSDDQVRERAKNCLKTGPRFAELNENGSTVPVGERSEADYYFCSRLAYWTGGDAEQIKRLFRWSDLARGKYAEKGHQGEDYLDRTVRRAIRDRKSFYDPSEGERMKEKVREVVRDHKERLGRSALQGSRRAVLEELLRIAEEVGSLQKRGVRFNANQEAVAAAVGVSQKTVSRIIKALREDGWIKRTEKGSKKRGRNSAYRLPLIGGVEEKDNEL